MIFLVFNNNKANTIVASIILVKSRSLKIAGSLVGDKTPHNPNAKVIPTILAPNMPPSAKSRSLL